MKIILTPEIENALNKHAHKKETTPERLALEALQERFVFSSEEETAIKEQGTLADYLVDHIGVLSSRECVPGGARMSEDCGRSLPLN